jgi:hypothetical protein
LILKERSKPLEIFALESLLQRISSDHPQYPLWNEKLRRITAGYQGEKRIDSLWLEIPIDYPHYFIHDLFIQKPYSSHQIDTILITSRYILVLEIKSISGLLNFDSQLRQFYRTNKNGSIDGMNNPDDQIRRHEKWVEHFLLGQHFSIPVIGAIVFTYPSSVIQSRPGQRIIIQSSGLPYLLDQLRDRSPKDLITEKKTLKLAKQIAELHSLKLPSSINLPTDIMKGVLCPVCPRQKLHYKSRKWRCNKCLHTDSSAHFQALGQYRVLFAPTITNSEFREFTGITSISIASKLLKKSVMPYQGSFKNRVYMIPEKF